MRKKFENKSGITMISVVVTIVILIILAGISINMTLGENGILTMAKRAKENMELASIEEQEKLNELYMQIEKEEGEISYDMIAKLNDFKKKIADYIEEAGGIKPEYTDTTETFGERIKGIVAEVTKDATATEEDIAEGKTAWVNGKLVTGNSINIINKNSMSVYKQSGILVGPGSGRSKKITLEEGKYLLVAYGSSIEYTTTFSFSGISVNTILSSSYFYDPTPSVANSSYELGRGGRTVSLYSIELETETTFTVAIVNSINTYVNGKLLVYKI